MPTVLIVDDELSVRESFSIILEGKYEVLLAASGEAALKFASEQKIALAYLDIRMPGLDGLETLKRVKKINPDLEVVMVTAVNDVKKAAEAVKIGAYDYIVKPFEVEAILKLTEEILRKKSLREEGKAIRRNLSEGKAEWPGLLGIAETLEQIASKEERVLILGEPGTEKCEAAFFIHQKSPRSRGPFQVFDLSAELTLAEMEEIIFGSSRGTNVAEITKLTGLLEKAEGGTLFLNNAEYLPEAILEKLAAVKTVRLIAAVVPTPADRINNFFGQNQLALSPLQEKVGLLPDLINFCLDSFNREHGRHVAVSPEAFEILSSYSWPGNAEELKLVIEKLVLSVSGTLITPTDLPFRMLAAEGASLEADFLSLFEKKYTRRVWEETGGNRDKTAELMGVNQAALSLLLSS